ncbi:hypothetical protein HMPREF0742_00253 [Rothia aeria F0184]|uniref:Uncharacterized protein n=1 Tax=Rothia aeria F0184 TaxID=888019 RepID=U7V977_9MICC|nr:hypothetical protein HMPREF0742_00253 [Rothia aeria F0184]
MFGQALNAICCSPEGELTLAQFLGNSLCTSWNPPGIDAVFDQSNVL